MKRDILCHDRLSISRSEVNAMFVIYGSYIKPIEEVERVLPSHLAYLDKLNEEGILICSGPMKPRTGGVIIFDLDSRDKIDEILKNDPFYIKRIVDYTIIEFTPTKAAADLGRLKKLS
ncbi:MAG: YciI family protein [Armatimonadota bacterium]